MDQIYDLIIKYNIKQLVWSEAIYHLLLKHIYYEMVSVPKSLMGHVEYYKSFICVNDDLQCLFYENDLSTLYNDLNLKINFCDKYLYKSQDKYCVKNEEEFCYLSYIDYLLGIAFRLENGTVTHVNRQLISFDFILNSKYETDEWFSDETRTFINRWIPICFNSLETPVYIAHYRLFGDLQSDVDALKIFFNRTEIPTYQHKIKDYFLKIYSK